MNNVIFARRVNAIIANLGIDNQMDVTSPVNGKAITIWSKADRFTGNVVYFACYSNDTAGLFGAAFKGTQFEVCNKVMDLAGY